MLPLRSFVFVDVADIATGIALAVYLVLTLVFGSMANIFIITFIVVILLQAADFWVVRHMRCACVS